MTTVGEFLKAKSSYLSEYTLRTYGYQLHSLEAWLQEKGADFADLTPTLFNEYVQERQWKPNSSYTALCAARSFVRWAYGAHHPLLSFRLKRPTVMQRTLQPEQVRKILAYLDSSTSSCNIRNASLITLMLDTGLRAFEICGLQIGHLDTERRIAYVIGKGNKEGYVTWGQKTHARLLQWLNLRKDLVSSQAANTVYVSISGTKPGTPLTPAGLRTIFAQIGRAVGVRFSPHDLRRTFATLSLQKGANTRQVQVLGRWTDIRMVERYSQALMLESIRDHFPFPVDTL